MPAASAATISEIPEAVADLPPLTLDTLLAPLTGYLTEELSDAGRPATLDFLHRWIAACAVYPAIRFPVTLALGKALAQQDGAAAPDEFQHLLLGRLRWFREGRMPAELRQPLAALLSDGDRRAVRHALVTLILHALNAPIPDDERGLDRLARDLARVSETAPRDTLQSDPILNAALRGWPLTAESVARAGRRTHAPRPWISWARQVAPTHLALGASGVVWAGAQLYTPTRTEQVRTLAPGPPSARPASEVVTGQDPAAGSALVRETQQVDRRDAEIQAAADAAIRRLQMLDPEGTASVGAMDRIQDAIRARDLDAILAEDGATIGQLATLADEQADDEARAEGGRRWVLYFPFDLYVITPEAQGVIDEAAAFARGLPGSRIYVVAHTSRNGSAAYNVRLTERAAKSVGDALAAAGVDQNGLTLDWRGESDPPIPTADGVKEPRNRRAVITVLPPQVRDAAAK